MTIREIYAACYSQYWDKPRYHESGWAREVRQYWTRHIESAFGDEIAIDIGPKAVREWHRSMWETPTTANRCLEVLSRVFRFGQEEELIPLGVNPCTFVAANTEKKRLRVPDEVELAKLGKELQKEYPVHPREVTFCYLLALTGARPRSITKARVDQLTIRDGSGVLRFDGKTTAGTGEQETVIIPANALQAVQALPRRDDGLLIGRVIYRSFWSRITRNAGVEGMWIRDFRRSFATIGLSCGVGIGPIGELLNHRSSQTTKNYARLLTTTRLSAAHTIASRMFHLLGDSPPAETEGDIF